MTEHHHDDTNRALVHMIDALTELIRDLHLHRKLDIIIQGQQDLMATFAQFVASQTSFNTRIGGAIDGLVGDVANLNAQIAALQLLLENGSLTAEQQAQLDTLIAAGEQIATRITTLDDMTPPVVPPTP